MVGGRFGFWSRVVVVAGLASLADIAPAGPYLSLIAAQSPASPQRSAPPAAPVPPYDEAELRALLADAADQYNTPPLWFKDADGRTYVAGVESATGAFRVVLFDDETYERKVNPTREWTEQQRTVEETRATEAKFNQFLTSLSEEHAGFRFVSANYSYNLYGLIYFAKAAPTLGRTA